MNIDHGVILDTVLSKAVDRLLDWPLASTRHPLAHCTAEVRGHIQLASELAKQERYDEAIEELTKASDKDPNYVGSRVRAMKYLIRDEKPLLGLLIGGGVLVLDKDLSARSQVWDMASGVALQVFKQTAFPQYIDEALTFSNNATRLSPQDILCNWNRIEVLLVHAEEKKKVGNLNGWKNSQEQAKKALLNLLFLGRKGGTTVQMYWPKILADAERIFPEQQWWKTKLEEMLEIGDNLEDQFVESTEAPAAARSGGTSSAWKRSLVAACLALLVWPDLYGMLPSDPTQTDQSPVVQEASPTENGQSNEAALGPTEERVTTVVKDIARVEREDVNLARVMREDIDLAATRAILDNVYVARIERDDADIV